MIQLSVVNAVKADFETGIKLYIYLALAFLVIMILCCIYLLMTIWQKVPKWLEKLDSPNYKPNYRNTNLLEENKS